MRRSPRRTSNEGGSSGAVRTYGPTSKQEYQLAEKDISVTKLSCHYLRDAKMMLRKKIKRRCGFIATFPFPDYSRASALDLFSKLMSSSTSGPVECLLEDPHENATTGFGRGPATLLSSFVFLTCQRTWFTRSA